MSRTAFGIVSASALVIFGLSFGPRPDAGAPAGSYQGGYYGPTGSYQMGAYIDADPAPLITDMTVTAPVPAGTPQTIEATANEPCRFRYRFGVDIRPDEGYGLWSAWTGALNVAFLAVENEIVVADRYFNVQVEAKDATEQPATNNPQSDNVFWPPI